MLEAMTATIEEVTPQEGQRRVGEGALLLDVREQNEYDEVRAEGARLMPLSTFDAHFHELPKDQDIVVICRSGKRSLDAATRLAAQGYRAVNLTGGTLAWEAEGLPVERGTR